MVIAADNLSDLISQRSIRGHEQQSRAVGSLSHRLHSAQRLTLLWWNDKWTFVVQQQGAIWMIEFPAYPPLVGAKLGDTAKEFHGCRVKVCQQAVGIGGVDGHGKVVHHVAELCIVLGESFV